MRVLALETSGSAASLAVLEADGRPRSLPLDPARRSAQTLAPGIRQLLQGVGWKPADVELVAVAIGPGSFTGLRLGVMTAKAFAYATGAAVLGVNTLEAIAAQAPLSAARIAVAVDAQRSEVYSACFVREPSGDLRTETPTRIVAADSWLAELAADAIVTGPALVKLAYRLPPHAQVVPPDSWFPTALAVGQLAMRRFTQGERDDVWNLAPLYFRRSAAEEKWDGQGK
ncbi:MAG: tRNA (adenosine(37)-N6)-threonylcarbamoyltransferase complex dimerization subunit type 1 TsaB [Planctomycetia bacterium]|nr:tRNA (adenosine(37)-N6)-threonylcarbamoyltransferase complex dimerization subunit type 1 TsaB [Planctomycetia bacterium]